MFKAGVRFPILLFSLMAILLPFSLRSVRSAMAEYCFRSGQYRQSVDWYYKILVKDCLTGQALAGTGEERRAYSRPLLTALKRAEDESWMVLHRKNSELAALFHDRSLYTKLSFLSDFSTRRRGRQSFLIDSWEPVKFLASFLASDTSRVRGSFLVGWKESEISFQGSISPPTGQLPTTSIFIRGDEQATQISIPIGTVDYRQGALSIWGQLIDPQKNYSTLFTIYSHEGANDRAVYLYHQGEKGYLVLYFGGQWIGQSLRPVADRRWHQYVLNWDQTQVDLYIDGQPVLSGKTTPRTTNPLTHFALGWLGGDNTEQWHGFLSQLLVFDAPLTPREILNLYGQPALDPA
jgi:hypothetical protein